LYDQNIPEVRCGLAYNLNGGMGLWIVIASDLEVDENGNGSYDWKIPCGQPRIESHCRVRVLANDGNQQQGMDMSDADFTIEYLDKGQDEPDPNYGGEDVPAYTYIGAPYPNPFNPMTSIRFGVNERTDVTMLAYDIEGILVKTICRKATYNPGHYIMQWDGRNDLGTNVTAGVYFLRFQAGDYAKTQKMVLIR
jgi:hypothetical protein